METRHRYTPLERLSLEEAALRSAKVREKLFDVAPEASGLLVFSRVNIYYLTGTMACGLYWLPRDGAGVLLVRKGRERARMESPVEHVALYRSFRDAASLLIDAGCPAGSVIAAEMGGLSWDMANLLQSRMEQFRFVPGDAALRLARAVKTPCELELIREAGRRHAEALSFLLPELISPGMTEWEIARSCMEIMLDLGHGGLMRMSAPGEEIFYGHVAADDSGNYPHYYNGPMGFRGEHPALPCLGGNTLWRRETPLTVDMGFCYNGYVTDKTQCFWAGTESSLPEAARAAFELCREVQSRAAEELKPGTRPSAIWSEALARAAKTPFADGFMGLGENAVPFLGHSLGLTIDEHPVIAAGFDIPLEKGMVIALEPKVGIPGFGMVGTEDTFEVTESGGKVLTRFTPEAEMIFLDA